MDTRPPTVIQQAQRPFTPLTKAEQQSVDMEYVRWQASHHARNDLQALRLQIAEQSRNDVNWTMV